MKCEICNEKQSCAYLIIWKYPNLSKYLCDDCLKMMGIDLQKQQELFINAIYEKGNER